MAAGSSRRPPPRRRRAPAAAAPEAPGPRAPAPHPAAGRDRGRCCWACWPLRAVFLGTVRAGDLSDRGVQQNRFEADLPAQRGAIQARNGADLAIDRLAVDVTATPYLVTDPEGTAAELGPAIERDPNEIANALARPRRLRRAGAGRAPRPGRPGQEARPPRHRLRRHLAALLPGRAAGVAARGPDRRPRTRASRGWSCSSTRPSPATPGHRVEVRDLLGNSIQMLEDREPCAGRERPAHDRPDDPGRASSARWRPRARSTAPAAPPAS